MKTFVTLALKALILFAFINTVSVKSFSQQTLTKINGWNAYIHLPDDYNSTGSKKYPTIIFFPGFHDYIELNNIQKGIYFLAIKLQNGKSLSQKIIKE